VGRDVDVVGVDDVDTVEPQTFEREFQRAHHAVVGIVEHFAARGHVVEGVLPRALRRQAELHQTADLGRQQVGIARLVAQEAVETRLRKAKSIEGGGVEIAISGEPRSLQRRARFPFRQRPVEVA